MTKKHFILIAALLNKWVWDPSDRALLFVEFGEVFAAHFPNFDRSKWHSARKAD